MSKLTVGLMICLMFCVLMSVAMAKPVALSDHQMSAIVASDEGTIDDLSKGVATDDNSGLLSGVGDDGKATTGNNNFADNSNGEDNSILKDLDATVTVGVDESENANNAGYIMDAEKGGENEVDNSTDNSVENDKSFNTDNSIDSSLEDESENANNAGYIMDAEKGGENEVDNSTDSSTENDKSFNTDNSTENAGNTGTLASKGGKVDNSVDNTNANNAGYIMEAEKGGENEVDNSIDSSVDNSISVKDGVYVTGLQNASGINLIIADGKVNAGSNILVVAGVNVADTSTIGGMGDIKAEIDDTVLNQVVSNCSLVAIGTVPCCDGPR